MVRSSPSSTPTTIWLTDHLDVVVEVFRRQPEAVLVSTCPKYELAGRQQSADAALTDYRSAERVNQLVDPRPLLLGAANVGFLSCIAVRAEAIRQAGGFDERLGAIEDSDLFRRLATLGPFATVRRRTVQVRATSGSLRRRAATSGRYLKAAELSAENLTTAVGRMPEADRRRLEDQPRLALHLARAMRALDRRDETTLRAELEIAYETYPLSKAFLDIGSRLRHHMPRFGQPLERLAMLETLTRAWPQPHEYTSRYMRAWAIGLALRLGRPGQALRMLRGWQWRGTARFGRAVAPSLWHRARLRWQERRYRGREADELASSQPSSPTEIGGADTTPTVSVVLPTHQRRKILRQAIASVLAQTYRDFELIVIDDGSTDGTGEMVESLDGWDGRLRYRWQPNRGASAARNAALRLAQGEIVAFLDSDNVWRPDHLERLVGALERHPDADLAHERPFVGRRASKAERVMTHVRTLLVGNLIPQISGVAVRRDAALAAGGFNERMNLGEDADLWLRLALQGRRFVGVPGSSVRKRRLSRSSVIDVRRAGEYGAAIAAGTEATIAELRRSGAPRPRLRLLGGRRIFIRAIRALARGDEERARADLEKACELLPSLSKRPRSISRHLRYDLAESAPRTLVAQRLLAAARLWPEPRSLTAQGLVTEAALELCLAGHPLTAARAARGWDTGASVLLSLLRSLAHARAREWARGRVALWRGHMAEDAWATTVQRLVVRSGARPPLSWAWRGVYEAAARAVAGYLVLGTGAAAHVRGSLALGKTLPGVSDIDLIVVLPSERPELPERRVRRRWRRLHAALPRALRPLFEQPRIVHRDELESTTLLHGLPNEPGRNEIVASSREKRREFGGAERPGLYGPAWDWRGLIGPRLHHPGRLWADRRDHALAAWLELQYWWLQAFRTAAEPEGLWKRPLCAKLVCEPVRIWLWLARGERTGSQEDLFARAVGELPDEVQTLRAAREWRSAPLSPGPPPLASALESLVRSSSRIAGVLHERVEAAGTSEVRLRTAEELIGFARSHGALGELASRPAGSLTVPLADWRSRTWPRILDEVLVLLPGEPQAELLRAAASADTPEAHPALRVDGLLVLPSLKGARLRAVQCQATDPVSFALFDGRSTARFPDLPALSASDTARRAVAEHLGWLSGPGRDPARTEQSLVRLLGGVRAGVFLQTADEGAAELDVCAAAIAERIGQELATPSLGEQAIEELRCVRLHGQPPSAELLRGLRRVTEKLPAYADGGTA